MVINYSSYAYPKVMRLFVNLSITVPFVITVLCCVMVLKKLRCAKFSLLLSSIRIRDRVTVRFDYVTS